MPYNKTTLAAPFIGDGDFLLAETNDFAPLAKPGQWMMLEATGEFGAATVKPFWIDQGGTKRYMQESGADISTQAPIYWTFAQPISRITGFEVSGSDGATALIFNIYPSAN